MVEISTLESPIGAISLAVHDAALCAVYFDQTRTGRFGRERIEADMTERFGGPLVQCADPSGAVSALRAYFDGDLEALDGLKVDPAGTAFQLKVWRALRKIRPGHVKSYRDLAAAVGAPSAVRAVGAANGANPIPLVLPCHRVIGSDGSLVGYGGGLERKRWLLEHEGALLFLRDRRVSG